MYRKLFFVHTYELYFSTVLRIQTLRITLITVKAALEGKVEINRHEEKSLSSTLSGGLYYSKPPKKTLAKGTSVNAIAFLRRYN